VPHLPTSPPRKVLLVGWDAADPDTLYVHDPYFEREAYSYAGGIDGWRLFGMEPCDVQCDAGAPRDGAAWR
jgi:hypothetical protein